ncbi:LysE family translocator [Agrobacterium larrymoorei]|uniref:Homoserine/homoserine lactone efflux protein n=1 Tax=Agrobacterium larrymoorei TaxID=160699 RepID=A0ABU0UND9_9HYPH|nr:LysE family transporter [Agrobacterium larrymoorei]MDQ1186484.1 homoserine/homoserine lactone efflux protein [Agrobacterium larrymoorei]
MSAQVWLVFCAACAILFALPSPIAFKVANYAAVRGKRTMIASVSGATLGAMTTFTAAAIVMAGAPFVPSSFLDVIQWAGIGWLMLFGLWTIATPAARESQAENDNLRARTLGAIFVDCFVLAALRLRYFAFFIAFLSLFINRSRDVVDMLTQMQAATLVMSLICLTLQATFARSTIAMVRRASATKKVRNTRGTRFITGRAVSAGYRRIAA